jgi:bacteriorhodopsin
MSYLWAVSCVVSVFRCGECYVLWAGSCAAMYLISSLWCCSCAAIGSESHGECMHVFETSCQHMSVVQFYLYSCPDIVGEGDL